MRFYLLKEICKIYYFREMQEDMGTSFGFGSCRRHTNATSIHSIGRNSNIYTSRLGKAPNQQLLSVADSGFQRSTLNDFSS